MNDVERARQVLDTLAARVGERPALLAGVHARARRRIRRRRVAMSSGLAALAVVGTLAATGVLPVPDGSQRGVPTTTQPAASPARTSARPTPTPRPTTAPGAPTWHDDFTGTALDRARWPYLYDDGTNSPIGSWSAADTTVGAGTLRLAVSREKASSYTSGGVGAGDSAALTGRWQVRWRMPAGPGVIGQLALVPAADPDRQPSYLATLEPGNQRLALTDTAGDRHSQLTLDARAYHTLALELTPNAVRWYVDGALAVDWPGRSHPEKVWPALQALQTNLDCGGVPLSGDCGNQRTAYPLALQVDSLAYWRA